MLHGGERFPSGQADVAHVADVKNSDTVAHRHVLGDNAAADRRWVFDGHFPAVKLHHLRAHLAMDGVQRSLADVLWGDGRSGFSNRHEEPRMMSCRDAAFPVSRRGGDGASPVSTRTIVQTVAGLPESGTEYVNTRTGRTQISGLRSQVSG